MKNNTNEKIIDGELFERIVVAGAYNLKAHIDTVNDLNVFPIPDGDTGDNMFMTIKCGLSGLKSVTENSVDLKAKALADGMLLNARGNSGVILSQLFAGLANGVVGLDTVDVHGFGEALKIGVKQAYASVVKPVEGTMLTVAREAADYGVEHSGTGVTLGAFFEGFVNEMKVSLDNTPNLLAVLKEAGVIDSGGAGLLYIGEGMKKAVEGTEIAITEDQGAGDDDLDFSKFTEDSEMVFGYCTEFLLQLQNSKVNAKEFEIQPIIDYLNTIGDSIVAFKTGTVVKVHVHTLTPYKALEYCQQFGEFLKIKIENMTLQHNETSEKTEPIKPKKKKFNRTKFGLVTVATGNGLINTFTEFGADVVIDGGQGKNPSIERFIEAFDDANADNIFVLPNNSNIIMAAKQARDLYKGSNIFVIETKNFGQAYSILSMLDYSADDAETIAENMKSDMANVVTGMITGSIRDANIDG
ncbi:MAG: DAK2 domain-containing protein, partial [Clostridia bacterium]|nr:DAK2 domain-containing protein [Clostridia bacterium]